MSRPAPRKLPWLGMVTAAWRYGLTAQPAAWRLMGAWGLGILVLDLVHVPILSFLAHLVWLIYAGHWQRHVAHRERPGRWGMQPDMDTARYGIFHILIGVLASLAGFVLYPLLGGIHPLLPPLVLGVAALALYARLTPWVAGLALGRHGAPREMWPVTRGQGWRIFAGYVSILLPLGFAWLAAADQGTAFVLGLGVADPVLIRDVMQAAITLVFGVIAIAVAGSFQAFVAQFFGPGGGPLRRVA